MKAVGAFLFFIGFIAIVAAKGIFFIKFVYLKWLVFYKFNKQMASISIQWINKSDQNLFNGNRLALLLSNIILKMGKFTNEWKINLKKPAWHQQAPLLHFSKLLTILEPWEFVLSQGPNLLILIDLFYYRQHQIENTLPVV